MKYTVTPLLAGVRNVDHGIMTYQRFYGKRIWLPMWSFLLRGPEHNILVDTGLDDFVTPEEFIAETGLRPDYLEDGLAAQGLTPDDIHAVINTHLHDDHCGNNPLFTKARFYIQKSEVESCLNPHPLDYRYEPAMIEDLDIAALDGDASPFPGIELIHTPGHAVGSQTVVVETAREPFIITGFCCSMANFPSTGPAVCPGVHGNAFQAYDNIQRVKDMRGVILPLHELTNAERIASNQ